MLIDAQNLPDCLAAAFMEELCKAPRFRPEGMADMFGGAGSDSASTSHAVVPDSYRRKAAHEMTGREFTEAHPSYQEARSDEDAKRHALYGGGKLEPEALLDASEHTSRVVNQTREQHENLVKDALSQGLSVPAHVLADYPHLAGMSSLKNISGVRGVKKIKAPKPVKSQRIAIVHNKPVSTTLSLFDEMAHPRAGLSETRYNPETGKQIKPGQFAPKPKTEEKENEHDGSGSDGGSGGADSAAVSREPESAGPGAVLGTAAERRAAGRSKRRGRDLSEGGRGFDFDDGPEEVQRAADTVGRGGAVRPAESVSVENAPVHSPDMALHAEKAEYEGLSEDEIRTALSQFSAINKDGNNYRITDEDALGEGGPAQKFRDNLAAITLLKEIEGEGRRATPEEQAILVKYTGWGWAGQLFHFSNDDTYGRGNGWKKEHDELKPLLTDEEWAAARASTTNAHYTAPGVIRAMWDAARHLGFKSGRVLEPSAGIGHFFGLMPSDMFAASPTTAVELDSLSGRITRQLYQATNTHIDGFQDAPLPDAYFDLAISNVPFGNYPVSDKVFNTPRLKFAAASIHNYFFAKALMKVRPGGVVAFITSSHTMDSSKAERVREYLAQNADFLGAVRLPNDAFENAGTEVTTDMIFLRRRGAEEEDRGQPFSKLAEIQTGEGAMQVNEYFAAHPEMMLGTMGLTASRYRGGEPALLSDGRDLEAAIKGAIAALPAGVYAPPTTQATQTRKQDLKPLAAGGESIGCYALHDGKLCMVEPGDEGVVAYDENRRAVDGKGGNVLVPVVHRQEKRIRDMIPLRDATRHLIDTMTNPDKDDLDYKSARMDMEAKYDSFVKKNGFLYSNANLMAFSADADLPLLLSLENYDRETKVATKADVFRMRTVSPPTTVTSCDNAVDAMLHAMNARQGLDWQHMANLTGRTPESLQAELSVGGHVFHNPTGDWETSDSYLSGNVREKLTQAEAAAAQEPRYQRNLDALKAVQPIDLTATDIDARLGATWVPADVIEDFTHHLVGDNPAFLENKERAQVSYSPQTGTWSVENSRTSRAYGARNLSEFGAGQGRDGFTGVDLLRLALNQKRPEVWVTDTHPGGAKRRFLDRDATDAAIQAQDKVKDEFKSWLWKDKTRSERLVGIYNRDMNNLIPREFNGQHLILNGVSEAAKARMLPHIKDAIWRILQDKNVLLDHAVGAGKAQPLDAKVLTPSGWRRMGDLQVGDLVIAGDGKPTEILAVHPQGEKDIFRVVMSDGAATECCDEHLWLTQNVRERGCAQRGLAGFRGKARPLSEIRSALCDPRGIKNHSIPLLSAPALFAPQEPYPALHPYVLGVLLGDGGLAKQCSLSFSSDDPEIAERVRGLLPDGMAVRKGISHKTAYDIVCDTVGGIPNLHHNPLRDILRDLEVQGHLSDSKFIPDAYKFGTPETRLEVLRGLMDTDGSADSRNGSAYFSCASKQLAEDAQFLVQSLGGVATRLEKDPTHRHKGEWRQGAVCCAVKVQMPPALVPFHLPRKIALFQPKTKDKPTRFIVEVEPAGRKEAQCITVADPDHLYVTEDCIVTHNSWEVGCAALELRRRGLARKPMITVPNHLVQQTAVEMRTLYPDAKILIATKKDFEKGNRKKFLAKVAFGDWDAVVIAHSTFGLLSVSKETEAAFYGKQIDEINQVLGNLNAQGQKNSPTSKDLEKSRNRMVAKLNNRMNKHASSTDDFLNFEQLGVDRLFVDEAHCFKNLEFVTQQQRVKGIPSSGSARAFDMLMKVRHIQGLNNGGGVTFATGTPITNTICEAYTLQRYLDPDYLESHNMRAFDSWSANFGTTATGFEYTATGEYKPVTRFSKFVNIPELGKALRRFTDTKTRKQLSLPVPEYDRHTIACPASEEQNNYVLDLADRAKAIQTGAVQPEEDNMLKITSDARKNSLDPRLVNSLAPEHTGGKVPVAAKQIAALYHQTAADKLTQVVFLDLGTPKMSDKRDATGNDETGSEDPDVLMGRHIKDYKDAGVRKFAQAWADWNNNGREGDEPALPTALTPGADAGGEGLRAHEIRQDAIKSALLESLTPDTEKETAEETKHRESVYQDMKKKLIAQGVKPEEIAYIHDAKDDVAKEALFQKVRKGDVRVLIGSTEKMGTGMNVQHKLLALHHIDCPWRPDQLEQREGRILRQGNTAHLAESNPSKKVHIYNYVTQGINGSPSMDTVLWGIIKRKAESLLALKTGDPALRSMDDVSDTAASAGIVIGVASGNPLVEEQQALLHNLSMLAMRHQNYQRKQEATAREVDALPGKIQEGEKNLSRVAGMYDWWQKNKPTKDEGFAASIGGQNYEKSEDAGFAILAEAKAAKDLSPNVNKPIGSYAGLQLFVQKDPVFADSGVLNIKVPGHEGFVGSLETSKMESASGALTRIRNVMDGLAGKVAEWQKNVERMKNDHSVLATSFAPSPHEEEIKTITERLAEINKRLGTDKEDKQFGGESEEMAKSVEYVPRLMAAEAASSETPLAEAREARAARRRAKALVVPAPYSPFSTAHPSKKKTGFLSS